MSINFTVIGISHRTASLEVREKLIFTLKNELLALEKLKKAYPENEHVIVSTCNRVEIYAGSLLSSIAKDDYIRFFAEYHSLDIDDIRPFIYSYAGHTAIEHLFKVASGLDSLVMGESQILGQLKESYERASKAGYTSKVLNTVFQKSFNVAKNVRTTTKIGEGNVSVSSVSCRLAEEILGNLLNKKVLLVGAGEMGGLTLKSLHERGASTVLVSSKNYEKAKLLAGKFGGSAVFFDEKERCMDETDILISATRAPRCIIHFEMIERVMARRRSRPLFMIDLAVPRDIEPAVNLIPGVHLYNIDSLKRLAGENLDSRRGMMDMARRIILDELRKVEAKIGAYDTDSIGSGILKSSL